MLVMSSSSLSQYTVRYYGTAMEPKKGPIPDISIRLEAAVEWVSGTPQRQVRDSSRSPQLVSADECMTGKTSRHHGMSFHVAADGFPSDLIRCKNFHLITHTSRHRGFLLAQLVADAG